MMSGQQWKWGSNGVLVGIATIPMVATMLLGGDRVQCVGTDIQGEEVHGIGAECDRLMDVAYIAPADRSPQAFSFNPFSGR